MPHNELRKDYLLDRWVVIATERGRRPTDFAKQKNEQTKPTGVCPLCPGNEHLTPAALLLYLRAPDGGILKTEDAGDFRHKNWLVRCIPNLFPAFSPPNAEDKQGQVIKSENLGLAIGHHEVLVETPNHGEHIANAELPQLLHVINLYIDRLRELSKKPYAKYVSIFRNHGIEGGASLTHPHSQIITTPFVPKIVEEELSASKSFWKQNGKCIYCDIIEKESKGPRCIEENEYFLVISPYASVHPMEFWIIPKRHYMNFLGLNEDEKKAFAKVLKGNLKGLKDLVNDPPYNYGFHLALDEKAKEYYHWHLEVYPRLTIWAGFEKNTGMFINTIIPETAAVELKKVNQI